MGHKKYFPLREKAALIPKMAHMNDAIIVLNWLKDKFTKVTITEQDKKS